MSELWIQSYSVLQRLWKMTDPVSYTGTPWCTNSDAVRLLRCGEERFQDVELTTQVPSVFEVEALSHSSVKHEKWKNLYHASSINVYNTLSCTYSWNLQLGIRYEMGEKAKIHQCLSNHCKPFGYPLHSFLVESSLHVICAACMHDEGDDFSTARTYGYGGAPGAEACINWSVYIRIF